MTAINNFKKILILSDSDLYGGASIAGYNLHQSLINNGFHSFMLVNHKISKSPTIIQNKDLTKNRINNLIEGKWNFPFRRKPLTKLPSNIFFNVAGDM